MTRKPNVLFITCDQWRGDCLSAAGHPVLRTPNVDRLAAEGVLFRRHYAGAAPCSPARACLYTGLYQMNNRVCRNGTPLDARHDTIALAARRAGYEPTLFGYSDTAPDPRTLAAADPRLTTYEGVLPGFAVRLQLPEHEKPWLTWLAKRGIDIGAGWPWIHCPVDAARGTPGGVPAYSAEETQTAFIAGTFIDWLGEQDGPWFAHLSFLRPHPPFIVPEPYNSLYAPDDLPPFRRAASREAESAIHPYARLSLERLGRGGFLPGGVGAVSGWDEATFRRIHAVYLGMIAEVDAQLGRVWEAVQRAGAWEETVIVLTSDHGELMGDHFGMGKGGFFEGSYHIPLVLRDPRRPAQFGTAVDRFTEAVDMFPTLCDLMGEAVPAHLDGCSLKPFLDGESPTRWRGAAHYEFDFRSAAGGADGQLFRLPPQLCNLAVLRGESYKYVHFAGLPPVLFDLAADPDETVNVADDPAYISLRLEAAERLLTWRARHLDQSLALAELTAEGVIGPVAPLQRGLG